MKFIMLFGITSEWWLKLMNDSIIQHVQVGATADVTCDHLARNDAMTVGMFESDGLARIYTVSSRSRVGLHDNQGV